MSSMPKFAEMNTKNVKKLNRARSISSYIEEERVQMLKERESPESIENFLYRSSKKAGTLTRWTSPSYPLGISSYCPLQPSIDAQTNVADAEPAVINQPATEPNQPQDWSFRQLVLQSQPFLPGDLPALSRDRQREDNLEHNQVNDACRNERLNPMWGADFPCHSTLTSRDNLIAELIVILREWSLNLYQRCMDDYKIMRLKNIEFWDRMLLKVLPPTMLEFCTESDISADFFHSLCTGLSTIRKLVSMKTCYLKFFLMNMAAVNRIECSFIHSKGRWNTVKRQLIKQAFIAGKIANLKLLLQYFQPNDLWSWPDMEFLETTTIYQAEVNYYRVMHGYRGKMTLLNLVRFSTYVSESRAPAHILAECIRLFWRTSDTPYVTLKDIKDAFRPLNCSLHLRHTFIRCCKGMFLRVYPVDCLMEYQPRSLKHLCRCKIRRAMTSPVHLPSLPLPKKMREYINLEF